MAAVRDSQAGSPQESTTMLRGAVLDGMRALLHRSEWAAVTMTDVAAEAGVSRRTVYDEFGSRAGLAQAYATRLADEFCAAVGEAFARNVDDTHAALTEGFSGYFAVSAADPLIRSLLADDAKPDLLRLITTDAGPLITRASARLADELRTSWPDVPSADAVRVGRAIARMALSYVAMPPEGDADVADDLADIFAPVLDAARR